MKDLLRLRTSLTEEIEKLLNDQIKMESHSSALYLSMASWCDRNGFDNSANYFYKQSNEERKHMLKIFHFVSDLGGHAVSPEIVNVQQEWESFRSVFEAALEQEISVTQSINRIVDRCLKAKDHVTARFLDWFLEEQIEEEFVARRALELFEVIGEEGVGQFMIDKEIPKIEYKP
ncbi:MAG: ferritin [Hymenobacteraceae bacterium]|nr:ferritin [Hymenobacteraceae bacterium]MDX5396159.1 ferritin [Hymenobacteraceae bacterium]MDX5443758.1 ferritin [Hymenobacteraceae bacterium]MDX5512222.1 ferritin [Hymenobacteraceae bacterium]